MKMTVAIVSAALIVWGNSAEAQTPDEVTAAINNTWLVANLGPSHGDAPDDLHTTFEQTGFAVTPLGRSLPEDDGAFCQVVSPIVLLNDVQPAIFDAARAIYTDGVPRPPGRVYRAGCHTMDVTVGDRRHRLEFIDLIGGDQCYGHPHLRHSYPMT